MIIKAVDCLSDLDLFEMSAAQEDLFTEEAWPVIEIPSVMESWELGAVAL